MAAGHKRFHQFCHEEALPRESGAGHAVVGVEAAASLPAAGFLAGLLLLYIRQELQHVLVQSALDRTAGLTGPTMGVFSGAVWAVRPRKT